MAPNTILDNNETVCKNCLSSVTNNNFIIISVRFKSYNKFIQSIESCSVSSKAGNHLPDYRSNPIR